MQRLSIVRIFALVFLLLYFAVSHATIFPYSPPPPRGTPIIGLVHDTAGEPMADINGIPWRFDKYRGQWIVVHYWASYCPPCLGMIPELNAIYYGREGKKAMVLGVNYDFVSSAEIHALVHEFQITYPVTQGDPAPKLGIPQVEILPATILINPKGEATDYLKGIQTQVSIENVIHARELEAEYEREHPGEIR